MNVTRLKASPCQCCVQQRVGLDEMTRRIITSVDDEQKSRATVAQAKQSQADRMSVRTLVSQFI